MTNFDFLLSTPKFGTFAPVAVSAEKSCTLTPRPVCLTAAVQWNLP